MRTHLLPPVGWEQGSPVLAGVLIKACETWHNTCCLVTYKDACSLCIHVSVWCLLFMSVCPSKSWIRDCWGDQEAVSVRSRLFSSSFWYWLLITLHLTAPPPRPPPSPNFCNPYILPNFSRAAKFEQISPQDCDTWNQHLSCSPEEPSIID